MSDNITLKDVMDAYYESAEDFNDALVTWIIQTGEIDVNTTATALSTLALAEQIRAMRHHLVARGV